MTVTPHAIFQKPVVFDVILGDFGRQASISYCSIVAQAEREYLRSKLGLDASFYDEYRRIMSVQLNVIEYLKRPAILAASNANRPLDDSILVGLEGTPVTRELVEAGVTVAEPQVAMAERLGYRRLRLIVPCNGLSWFAEAVAKGLRGYIHENKLDLQIAPFTVPKIVAHHVASSFRQRPGSEVLVLGTSLVNSIYAEALGDHDLATAPLTEADYAILDRAIVSAISGDSRDLAETTRQIADHIVAPFRGRSPGVVIEACTDFNLGLGLNSLEVFAQAMTELAYVSE